MKKALLVDSIFYSFLFEKFVGNEPGKRDSDWGYAMVPVIGPIIGGVLAALAYPLMAKGF